MVAPAKPIGPSHHESRRCWVACRFLSAWPRRRSGNHQGLDLSDLEAATIGRFLQHLETIRCKENRAQQHPRAANPHPVPLPQVEGARTQT
jgi:hypothetical protein